MRLLYLIVTNDPGFISRIKNYYARRGLPMRKFWQTMALLKDISVDDVIAPQLIRFLHSENLLADTPDVWEERLNDARVRKN